MKQCHKLPDFLTRSVLIYRALHYSPLCLCRIHLHPPVCTFIFHIHCQAAHVYIRFHCSLFSDWPYLILSRKKKAYVHSKAVILLWLLGKRIPFPSNINNCRIIMVITINNATNLNWTNFLFHKKWEQKMVKGLFSSSP